MAAEGGRKTHCTSLSVQQTMAVVAANDRRKPKQKGETKTKQKLRLAVKHDTANVTLKAKGDKKRTRATYDPLYDSDEMRSSIRAEEIRSHLAPEFPSMIKRMKPSHVAGGFWLGLSKEFCVKHMPHKDSWICLEDENGEVYETKYLAEKVGLSAGWRGFSIAHHLVEGDVLIFHMVSPNKFKVYILRLNESNESNALDGALELLKLLKVCSKQMNSVGNLVLAENQSTTDEEWEDQENPLTNSPDCNGEKKEVIAYQKLEHLSRKNPEESNEKDTKMICDPKIWPMSDEPEIEPEDKAGVEYLDGIRFSESLVKFEDVNSFEKFDICVNGLIINSELTKESRTKYYELCCSQKSYLHEHLLEGLNCKLAAGMIAELVNIADAIKAAKPSTSCSNFVTWKKTLKAFESMGINVNFLIHRLDQLMSLAAKHNKYEEVRLEKAKTEEEMRTLEAKLQEVKETVDRLDREIGKLEADAGSMKFQDVVRSPW